MRKSFINVLPVNTLKLSVCIRTPQYLNLTEYDFFEIKIENMDNYFIDARDTRYWLNATAFVNASYIIIDSEPINVAKYRQTPKEYHRLFCDIIKQVRKELKKRKLESLIAATYKYTPGSREMWEAQTALTDFRLKYTI